MSRIGKSPITVPAGVTVEATAGHVKVTGPQGSLERSVPEGISLTQEGDVLTVSRIDDSREHRSLHGLLRTLIANMVTGVTTGYTKELEIVGVGYRCAAKGPDSLELALGFSHPVFVDAPKGITFEVPAPTLIRSRLAKWRPTFASFASLSLTRARACATPASTCFARLERRPSNGRQIYSRASNPSS